MSTSFKPGFPLPTTVENKALKNKCFRVDGLAFSLTLSDQGADDRKCTGRGAHNSKLDYVTSCDLVNSSLPAPVLQLRRKTQVLRTVPSATVSARAHTGLDWEDGRWEGRSSPSTWQGQLQAVW